MRYILSAVKWGINVHLVCLTRWPFGVFEVMLVGAPWGCGCQQTLTIPSQLIPRATSVLVAVVTAGLIKTPTARFSK